MSYNGWRNRETWLVNIWYNPMTKSDIDYLEQHIEDEFYEVLPNGFWRDMIDITCIDWESLREYCDEDEEE
tara:strand:+ start:764 stop:976 length:213 start_codon:yes stop_codon:yes gene_type:complete